MDKNEQILRINGSKYAERRAREEKYLNRLEDIIESGAAVGDDESAKEYKVEDLLEVFGLLRHITVEVLCHPIHVDEDLAEKNKNDSFTLKDAIRLMKVQFQDGVIFYPVFTGDEALKAAIKYGTNVTLKMPGEEFLDKMKSLAPAFIDGRVTGIAINPNTTNRAIFIPGKLFLYSLNDEVHT